MIYLTVSGVLWPAASWHPERRLAGFASAQLALAPVWG